MNKEQNKPYNRCSCGGTLVFCKFDVNSCVNIFECIDCHRLVPVDSDGTCRKGYAVVSKPCKTVVRHAMCECGGEYKCCENIVLTTYPVQYPHDCDKCGNRITFFEKYPYVDYDECD